MEDSAVFIYILVIIALIIKGVIDFIWKKAAQNIPQNPPIDATQLPNKPRKHATNGMPQPAQQKRSEPVVQFNEGERALPNEPLTEDIADLSSSPLNDRTEDASPMLSIRNADDLRKAVIYSEILHRKY